MENENLLELNLINNNIIGHINTLVNHTDNLRLIIRNPRKSFYGNMIYAKKEENYKIYLNRNLSPHFFLYVFLHEYAHVLAHIQYGRKIKPHGKEWQNNFFILLKEAMEKNLFEINIKNEIETQFLRANIYSNLRDTRIKLTIDKIDLGKVLLYIKDVPLHSVVLLPNNLKLKIEKKIRTRYLCSDMNSRKKYLVPGFMPVKEIITKSE